ncbi:hypothetical protein GQ457_05G015130 [Hibiscus cannabinus]
MTNATSRLNPVTDPFGIPKAYKAIKELSEEVSKTSNDMIPVTRVSEITSCPIVNEVSISKDDGRCSRIGANVLRIGGHAVDAAVATSLCLGVVSPASSGIGGGSFMLLREANGKTQVFDMRETAPMKASENMYTGNATLKATGGLSISVPGQLAGLHKAWKQHGILPWKRLVKPAEILAREGFKISPYLSMQMESSKSAILADEGLRVVFAPNGELLKVGDICYNKKLAQTLRKISMYGVHVFYNGSIGCKLVRDVQKAGGILTLSDLEKYEVKMREPVSANILGLEVLSMSPPSSGGASMALILNILAQYEILTGPSGPLGTLRLIESLKHAFAVRMNLGDPGFVNIMEVVADMLSPQFTQELQKTINDSTTFGPEYYGGKWNPLNDHGTSHVSIVDTDQNVIPPPSAPSNFIRTSKRPLSSMTPTIVLKDGELKAVVGASGGANIIAGTTQVFLNHFALGMDPLSSVMAPRVYHQLIPNVVMYENWTSVTGDHFEVPTKIRSDLQEKGHVLQVSPGATVSQFILQNFDDLKRNRKLVAVSDPRKGGFHAGF